MSCLIIRVFLYLGQYVYMLDCPVCTLVLQTTMGHQRCVCGFIGVSGAFKALTLGESALGKIGCFINYFPLLNILCGRADLRFENGITYHTD